MSLPVPSTNEIAIFGKEEMAEIFEQITDEIKKRLSDPKHIRKLDTEMLLTHMEKIVALANKSGAPVPVQIQNNLAIIQSRAKELDSHPARRKELREQTRKLNGVSR